MNERQHWIDVVHDFLAWGDVNPIKFIFIVWLVFVGILKGLFSGNCHCKNCEKK